MQSSWRIIYSSPARGAWNMAVDEAILESAISRQSLPTLRLYSWQPACLSLGFSQPFADVDTGSLTAQGWDVVRRPTGGRAILHTDELTYSVCGRYEEPALRGSLLDSYFNISSALQKALDLLGLTAAAEKKYPLPEGSTPKGPVCFEVPSNYEITAGGKKLIGSAQMRRKEGLLQHGSLPLTGDLRRITLALTYPLNEEREKAAERVLQRATTVQTITGQVIPLDHAARAFETAFSETLGLLLEPSDLTPLECERASQLVETKYANPTWTERL